VACAVRLTKKGWLEEAIAQYDAIHAAWPDAKWTEDVSGRLADDADRTVPAAGEADGARGTTARPPEPTKPLKTYSVLIGISRYNQQSAIPWLKFADNDADLFAQYLASPRGGNGRICKEGQVSDCEILLLTNEEATLARVSNAFGTDKDCDATGHTSLCSFVAMHAAPDNALVFFIGAHGVGPVDAKDWKDTRSVERKLETKAKTEPAILTYDADIAAPDTSALRMSELNHKAAIAAQSYGRVLVFVDVCRAGFIGGIPPSPNVQAAASAAAEWNERAGVYMATDQTNNAFEFEELGGHGVFTYYAIAGLSATDRSSGSLTSSDLEEALLTTIRAATGRAQTPSWYVANHGLVVVDDLSKPAITLLEARKIANPPPPRGLNPLPSAPKTAPASVATPADADPFLAGHLRRNEPGSAWAEWERLRASGDARAGDYANRLRTALEDRGQRVILDYLRGDQDPVPEGEFTQGAEDFEAALELAPSAPFNESRALFCRGRALIFHRNQADFERAIELLQQSIRLDSKRGYAYNALGIAYLENAASDAALLGLAEKALHDAIHYSPYWPYPWHNLALVLTERGEYDAAIECYRHAMKLAPQYPYLPYNLGLLYQRINRLKDAATMYQEALKTAERSRGDFVLWRADGRKPEEAEALNALGTLAEKGTAKGAEGARKLYEQSIADDPEILSARHNLAALIARTDPSSSEPEQLWKEVLARKCDHAPSLLGYSRYLVQHGRLAEAVEYYRALLKVSGDFGPAHRELGAALAALHQPADALREMQLARNLAGSDVPLLEGLGDSLRDLGQAGQARQAYKLAIDAAGESENRKTAKRLEAKKGGL
jgi:tetratricopeptide (TPR) repeat protein